MKKIISIFLFFHFLILSNLWALEQKTLDRRIYNFSNDDREYFIEFVVRRGKEKSSTTFDLGHAYVIWSVKRNSVVINNLNLFISSLEELSVEHISSPLTSPTEYNSSIFNIYPKDNEEVMNLSFKDSYCKYGGSLDYTSEVFLQTNGYLAYLCETKEAFGFYPLKKPIPSKLTVPAKLKDEFMNSNNFIYETTHSMIVKIDALQFEKSRLILLEWKLLHNEYRLLSMDCVSFSSAIASAIGLEVPDRGFDTMKPEWWIKKIIEKNNNETNGLKPPQNLEIISQ